MISNFSLYASRWWSDTAQQKGSLEISNPWHFLKLNSVSSKIPATTSMFCPKLPRISLAFSGVFSNVTIWNLISEYIFWIFGHSSTNTCGGVIGETPTRITSLFSFIAFCALATESLLYWMIYFVSLYKDFPASVTISPRCVLSNNWRFKLLSSELICLITAGAVIYIFSAALLKPPASTTHKNVSSWGLYIIDCHSFPARIAIP